MDPARKRTIRLVAALTAAVLLAGALVYTSFSASSEARTPSQLLSSAKPGRAYQLTGKVVDGSIRHRGATTLFRVRDRSGSASVPVSYTGSVPDPFRDGREVIVTVHERRGNFVGERDTLITKCPSKYSDKPQAQ
jgi:cytochrome c-type biogenesis protein CcmE